MCDNWSRPGHGPSKSYRIATLEAERGWSIPALAVTAYARAEDRTRALSSGFQMHVAKPLEPADLDRICQIRVDVRPSSRRAVVRPGQHVSARGKLFTSDKPH